MFSTWKELEENAKLKRHLDNKFFIFFNHFFIIVVKTDFLRPVKAVALFETDRGNKYQAMFIVWTDIEEKLVPVSKKSNSILLSQRSWKCPIIIRTDSLNFTLYSQVSFNI